MVVDKIADMTTASQLSARPRDEAFFVAVALALDVDLPGTADQPVERKAVAALEGRGVANTGQRFE